MSGRNEFPEITPEERKEIRACLEVESNDGIYEDIERCKMLKRHPFAKLSDIVFLEARIEEAEKLLIERLQNAIGML